MSDKPPPPAPDYAALAQRYLDLWQDQVAKLAKDPQDLTALTAAWSKMAASMAPGTAPGPGPGASHDPHRPAPAAPSHGDGGVDRAGGHGGPGTTGDDRLADRVAVLEQRIAVLESRLADPKPVKPRAAGGGRGPRKKS